MNAMTGWLEQPAAYAFGWTLVHSLWQIAGLGVCGGVVLGMMRGRSPNARYVAGCIVLAAMLAVPVATFAWMMTPGGRGGAVSTEVRLVDPAVNVPAMEVVRGVEVIATTPAGVVRNWLPYAVMGYFFGATMLTLRLAAGCLRLRRLRTRGVPAAGAIVGMVKPLAERLGIWRAVSVLESALVEVPTTLGIVRPVILLPVAAMTGLSPEQVRLLVAHELAHIRRHDFAVNLVQSIIETLLFYHPAVWWISGRIRQERELCADDLAVVVTGDRVAYARALAGMEMLRAETPRRGLLTFPSAVLAGVVLAGLMYVLGCNRGAPAPGPSTSATQAATAPAPAEDASLPADLQPGPVDPVLVRLRSVKTNFSAKNEPLDDVLRKLAREQDFNLSVEWPALAAVGVQKTSVVKVSAMDAPITDVLDAILKSLGDKLAYRVDEGVLTITTRDQIKPVVVVRVFDVRDLVSRATDVDKSVTQEKALADITATIETTVAPGTWHDGPPTGSNDPPGSIRPLNGQLIIAHTRENLAKVYRLVQQMREAGARQIAIEARIYYADDEALKQLGESVPLPAIAAKTGDTKPAKLDASQFETLLQRVKAIPSIESLTAPRLTLFDHSEADFQIGKDEPYLAPTTEPDGTVAAKPKMLSTGIFMPIRANMSVDGKTVSLDVKVKIVNLIRLDKQQAKGVDKPLLVDVPVISENRLQAKFEVASGEAAVMAGRVMGKVEEPDGSIAEKERNMIVVVRATAIVQKEIPAKP